MMNFEKFTEKAQETIQRAQSIMLDSSHNQLDADHILMALLDQNDSLAVRILQRLRVSPDLARDEAKRTLGARPRVTSDQVNGPVAQGQMFVTPQTVAIIQSAGEEADRLDDEYVGNEHLLLALTKSQDTQAGRTLRSIGIDPEGVYRALREIRGAQRSSTPSAESRYEVLRKYSVSLTDLARAGPARSPDRADSRGPAGHPGVGPSNQEQPGADRRARCGQDRHR